jgi:hypothetical protein
MMNFSMKKSTFLLLFLLSIYSATGQQVITESDIESDKWYEIYTSSSLTLYVQFFLPPANEICRSNSPITFVYRYKGNLAPSEQYAIWELDYLDCGGITKKMTAYAPMSSACQGWRGFSPGQEFNFRERDEIVTARELVELRGFNKGPNSYSSPGNTEVVLKESITPERLTTSKRTVRPGEEITLTVEGGALGEKAFWELYDGSCGKDFLRSFSERSTKIIAKNSTVYYVRAIGDNNETNCVEIEINVDKSSTPPSHIMGQDEVCNGAPVNLQQKGGELGPDSQWYWYMDACGNTEIGRGASIQHTPSKTTLYYVRSQSNDGNELGPCAEKKVVGVSILNKSGADKICEGVEVILKADGQLVEGAYWVWQENNLEISRDIEIKRSPLENAEYTLYIASDACGPSEKFGSKNIEVYKKSRPPEAITQKFNPEKNNKSSLVLEGGYLAENSEWRWYIYDPSKINKKKIDLKDYIVKGRDESIPVEKKWGGNSVYVIAYGDFCNDETRPVIALESIQKKVKSKKTSNGNFSLRYAKSGGKWFHFGIQAGANYLNLKDSIDNINDSNDKKSYNVQSLAYFVGGELHPLFFDQFYLGVHGGYGLFAKNYRNYSQITNSNPDRLETGNGSLSYFGGETGWTISKEHAAKMFVKYTRTGYNNNLVVEEKEYDPVIGQYVFQTPYENVNTIVIDRLSFGFRFGAFDCRGKTNKSAKPKLGRSFDFMVNMHNKDNLVSSDLLSDFSSFSQFKDWKIGFEMAHWKHNVFRIGFNFGFNSSFSQLFSKGNEFMPDYFTATFAYNFDLFR